ncbi:hypothetical protein [Brevundimonas sp.]
MTKPKAAADINAAIAADIAAEVVLQRQEDEARAARVRDLQIRQLPVVDQVTALLDGRSIAETLPDLKGLIPALTDGPGSALANFVAHGEHLTLVLGEAREKIAALVAEDEAKAAEAAAQSA